MNTFSNSMRALVTIYKDHFNQRLHFHLDYICGAHVCYVLIMYKYMYLSVSAHFFNCILIVLGMSMCVCFAYLLLSGASI